MRLPLAFFFRWKSTPKTFKILKSKEGKMSRGKRKLTTAINNKKYRRTPVYHQAAKPVTTGFHPNKILCAIAVFFL